MANEVKLTFAGDAGQLQNAARKAQQATQGVAESATNASDQFSRASQGTNDFVTRVGRLGAAVDGASTAVSDIGGGIQALADFQSAAANRAARLARAQADVEQAMLDAKQAAVDLEQATIDLSQAQIDGQQAGQDAKQAQIDVKQSMLDAKTATDDYNKAVREHGRNSAEAQQAAIDLEQAQADLAQANIDARQAQTDLKQAQTDGKQAAVDSAQAVRDAKDAQLDLNEAQREANPTDLQKFAEQVNTVTPLISALVAVVALATAAQWAWNVAQAANPIGLIIIAIVALVAVIVLIATKTDWFQRLWKAIWAGIVGYINYVKKMYTMAFNAMIMVGEKLLGAVTKIPGLIAKVWGGLFGILTAPFRAAFNFISRAWNGTVGRLSWSVPGWVPGIGGNSISAPTLPQFHSGGVASGAMGSEFLAVLRAGERVVPTAGGNGPMTVVVEAGSGGSSVERHVAALVLDLIRTGAVKLVVRNNRVAVP